MKIRTHQYDLYPSEILVDLAKAISNSSNPNIDFDRIQEIYDLQKQKFKLPDSVFIIQPRLKRGPFPVWFALRLATDPSWKIANRLNHFHKKFVKKDNFLGWLEFTILDMIGGYNLVDHEEKIRTIVDWIDRKKGEGKLGKTALVREEDANIVKPKKKEKPLIELYRADQTHIGITIAGQRSLLEDLKKEIKKYRIAGKDWTVFDKRNSTHLKFLRNFLESKVRDIEFFYDSSQTKLGNFFYYKIDSQPKIFDSKKTVLAGWIQAHFYYKNISGVESPATYNHILSCLYGKQVAKNSTKKQ